MRQDTNSAFSLYFKLFIQSLVIVFLLFLWQGNKGFNLADEGYLWYGIQRVLLGEVPIRDFMAYDPGRYYWAAALLHVAGDSGIMGVRAAVAIFQALGLFVGTLLIARATPSGRYGSHLYWLMASLCLVVWMFPRHKLFDISLSMFLIGLVAHLVQKNDLRSYFWVGAGVGMAAIFGRNHGVYGVFGSLMAMAWLCLGASDRPSVLKGAPVWGLGVAAGFLPIVLMVFLVPDFGVAFWESIRLLWEQEGTNLPLPVPWPWRVDMGGRPFGELVRQILIGVFFIGLLAYALSSLAWILYARIKGRPVSPVIAATAFLALPYTQYAYSRADVGHLAHGVYPMLIGCFIVLGRMRAPKKWIFGGALSIASLWVMFAFHPGWRCLGEHSCTEVEISGAPLMVDRAVASDVALLRSLASRYAPNGEPFIAVPFWPGAYALLERPSPIWEIYPIVPRTEQLEMKEITRIETSRPAFVIVYDMPLDNRQDLRFKNTHPLVHQYIVDHFDRVPYPEMPSYQIYQAR
jgi:hypothetical protein